MILNLKKFNTSVESPHFKMELFKNVTNMIYKNVDREDGYFIITVYPGHQAFLKFLWKFTYQFTAMPNEYADAITKTLKSSFALLRKFGHFSAEYVDDTYL